MPPTQNLGRHRLAFFRILLMNHRKSQALIAEHQVALSASRNTIASFPARLREPQQARKFPAAGHSEAEFCCVGAETCNLDWSQTAKPQREGPPDVRWASRCRALACSVVHPPRPVDSSITCARGKQFRGSSDGSRVDVPSQRASYSSGRALHSNRSAERCGGCERRSAGDARNELAQNRCP